MSLKAKGHPTTRGKWKGTGEMKIYTLTADKGGTGKTTSAAALAQAAAFKGKKVLALDMDQQANLSYALDANPETAPGSSFDIINGSKTAQDVIVRSSQNLDVIVGSWALATLTTHKGSAKRLQSALEPLKRRYDVVFIDTHAGASEAIYNALQASDGVIIPAQADIYNIQVLKQTIITAESFIQGTKPDLKISGVIITELDSRSNIKRKITELIERQAAPVPILGKVRKAVAIEEAAALQLSLYDHAPKSKPAIDYMEILKKLI